MVKARPDGYPSLTPYLIVRDGVAAIDFYCRVLGARERMRMPGPGGRVGHAELDIGTSLVMLADEAPEHDAVAPGPSTGRSPSACISMSMMPTRSCRWQSRPVFA